MTCKHLPLVLETAGTETKISCIHLLMKLLGSLVQERKVLVCFVFSWNKVLMRFCWAVFKRGWGAMGEVAGLFAF